MKRLLLILLCSVLTNSFPIYAQTISVSVTDWQTLRTELQNSKVQLANSNEAVLDLQSSLSEAKESQQSLEQTINDLNLSLEEAKRLLTDSEKRISALEAQLQAALEERNRLQNRIDFLESHLTGLSQSLTNTQEQLDKNEEKHVSQIERIVQGYQTRETIGKVVIFTLLAIIVGETVYIAADALTQ